MLKKNSKLAFGGMWVFPGGRIDDADREGVPDIEAAARRAAVREALEEAALVVDEDSLAFISHWTPPGLAPKREMLVGESAAAAPSPSTRGARHALVIGSTAMPRASIRKGYSLVPWLEPRYLTTRKRRVSTWSVIR